MKKLMSTVALASVIAVGSASVCGSMALTMRPKMP